VPLGVHVPSLGSPAYMNLTSTHLQRNKMLRNQPLRGAKSGCFKSCCSCYSISVANCEVTGSKVLYSPEGMPARVSFFVV